jgi:thymidylate kinase
VCHLVGTLSADPDVSPHGRPLVVEIAGPAGAGKSSLLLALSQQNGRITALSSFRGRIGYLPVWVSMALWKLPRLLPACRTVPGITRKELRLMVHLMSMHRLLEGVRSWERTVTVLDRGPVYMLTRLSCCGLDKANDRAIVTWWNAMLKHWASRLQLVIWLDAPTGILVERIRSRKKWHVIKGASEEEAARFLVAFRTGYEQIVGRLTGDGGPRVLHFDTAAQSLEEVAAQVLAALGAEGVHTAPRAAVSGMRPR